MALALSFFLFFFFVLFFSWRWGFGFAERKRRRGDKERAKRETFAEITASEVLGGFEARLIDAESEVDRKRKMPRRSILLGRKSHVAREAASRKIDAGRDKDVPIRPDVPSLSPARGPFQAPFMPLR